MNLYAELKFTMHYVVFQGTEQEGKTAVSEQYYTTLVPLLDEIPGFIKETAFAPALYKERSNVLVASFEDEEAIRRWAKRTHTS